jgi:uncharacterized RDD family membrane protein YckC
MPITVLDKGNVPSGPFTRAQVAEKLQRGEFSLEDLAFVEGLSQWTPLRGVLARVDAALPPLPPVVPWSAPAPAQPVSPAAYSYAATMEPPPHLVYAGFWLRVVAYLIDGLILGIPITVAILILAMFMGGFTALVGAISHSSGDDSSDHNPGAILPMALVAMELVFAVVVIVINWLYYALLESGPGQSTLGKRALGLKVTDMAGERISFGHASGRFFGKIITGLIPFGIGYMMAGFTARKQALHDLIAGTLVVRN